MHVHDEQAHFEFLILEGAQAGLSWSTILKKREGDKKVFANFDPNKVSKFNDKKIDTILLNPIIVRNRLKVYAAVNNACGFSMTMLKIVFVIKKLFFLSSQSKIYYPYNADQNSQ